MIDHRIQKPKESNSTLGIFNHDVQIEKIKREKIEKEYTEITRENNSLKEEVI